ncbi:MAG: Succinate dehydrogenase flavoprotein subunit, partial [uncultured Phycisphaerae bacterium]
LPHLGAAGRGRREDEEGAGRLRGYPRRGPQPDLEQRPRRGAGARQPDRQCRHHRRQRRCPQGEPRRPCAGGLSRARRRQLDETHPVLGRREWRGQARLSRREDADPDERGPGLPPQGARVL